jgi:HSP20 family protein
METDVKETKKANHPAATASRGLMPFDDFDNLFDDFLSRRWPRLFDRNFPSSAMGSWETSFPKVDIIDHDNELEVKAALPGIKKEDLDVSINNQTITIRTTTKEEKKEEGKYFRREITRGEYQRTLSLPDSVDADQAKASFKDGILKVTIPKTNKGKRKSININD